MYLPHYPLTIRHMAQFLHCDHHCHNTYTSNPPSPTHLRNTYIHKKTQSIIYPSSHLPSYPSPCSHPQISTEPSFKHPSSSHCINPPHPMPCRNPNDPLSWHSAPKRCRIMCLSWKLRWGHTSSSHTSPLTIHSHSLRFEGQTSTHKKTPHDLQDCGRGVRHTIAITQGGTAESQASKSLIPIRFLHYITSKSCKLQIPVKQKGTFPRLTAATGAAYFTPPSPGWPFRSLMHQACPAVSPLQRTCQSAGSPRPSHAGALVHPLRLRMRTDLPHFRGHCNQ
jgi:hypothetical protein